MEQQEFWEVDINRLEELQDSMLISDEQRSLQLELLSRVFLARAEAEFQRGNFDPDDYSIDSNRFLQNARRAVLHSAQLTGHQNVDFRINSLTVLARACDSE